MSVIEITNLEDPALDVYARLTETQLRSRRRPQEALFIAESVKAVRYAMDAGCRVRSFLMERKHITGDAAELIARAGDAAVYTGDPALLEHLTGFKLSRGILAAVERPRERTAEEVIRGARRLAVLEGITDVTNCGAIFRSAAALGVDGVLLDPTCCDPLIRRSVRVSLATVLQVPWARFERWPGGMDLLREAGFSLAALALTEDAIPLDDPRLRQTEKLALLLGTEGTGLKKATIDACDWSVIIPMHHGVDSLNVGAAAAVAFWECRRR